MITVYGLNSSIATKGLVAWLQNNNIQFKYVEATDDMKYIKTIPTIHIMKHNSSYTLHGFNADTTNKILDIIYMTKE